MMFDMAMWQYEEQHDSGTLPDGLGERQVQGRRLLARGLLSSAVAVLIAESKSPQERETLQRLQRSISTTNHAGKKSFRNST
ncbi:MAG TPA: hypothetical protein VM487_00010 [Phycisphaerae bacterium]|nr:hypothetical protein [Phycisphaerae bacterium]